jgi:hypothetical protein
VIVLQMRLVTALEAIQVPVGSGFLYGRCSYEWLFQVVLFV